jgi:hypothetical protein
MRLLIIPILFLTSITTFAQIEATTKSGAKVILQLNKTWDYAPETKDKPTETNSPKQTAVTNSFITDVKLEKVNLFFSDYVGKRMKFHVWLGEIDELSGKNQGMFGIQITSEDGKRFYNFPNRDSVTFLLNKGLARTTLEAREKITRSQARELSSKISADISVSLRQVGEYRIADIDCIEIMGHGFNNGQVVKGVVETIGLCK